METGLAADILLWDRWKQGDMLAFEEIVKTHTARLLAVATRLTRDANESEDVVQETFLAVWRSPSGFDGRSLLSTWLHRVTVNAALARLRRRSRRWEVPMDQAFPPIGGESHLDIPDHSEALAAEQAGLREEVWAAVNGLQEEQRVVVVLRDVEEMPSKEVASTLGISDATVRQRLHRARQILADRLRPELRTSVALTCGGRLDLLMDHLDGTLEAAWFDPVQQHLADCMTCTHLAEDVQGILTSIRASAPTASVVRSQALVNLIIKTLRATGDGA